MSSLTYTRRFLVVNIDKGTVMQTDDQEAALDFSQDDSSFVIDTEQKHWLFERIPTEVEELPIP